VPALLREDWAFDRFPTLQDQAANEAGFHIERSTDGQHWHERSVFE
jgi:hypothetical protein